MYNKENKYGKTPLMIACKKGNMEIVKYLIEHGADVNKENVDGKTPLCVALDTGDDDIVAYLRSKGAK